MSGHKLIIGKFWFDQYGVLRGHIGGLGVGSVEVVSQDVTSLSGKPYMRLIADPIGKSYEIGSAFPKCSFNKTKYFSVKLDSPFWAVPVRAALFQDRNDELVYNLIWSRDEVPKSLPAEQPPA